uniref:Uncharacterized protein n=1 Tax=Anguilla anguilla TaxID=7936 RepID=A0A0E9QC63_ANGAN
MRSVQNLNPSDLGIECDYFKSLFVIMVKRMQVDVTFMGHFLTYVNNIDRLYKPF